MDRLVGEGRLNRKAVLHRGAWHGRENVREEG